MTQDSIQIIECQALQLLLAGNDPVLAILRTQLELSSRQSPELTGAGFVTRFCVPSEAPCVPGRPTLRFGDVAGKAQGLKFGLDFVVFVDEGVLNLLEVCTFEEPWPQSIGDFQLTYSTGTSIRDFIALRNNVGWPTDPY